jgi:alpha-ketoglutarate-dependent 2,4-dichlorophenoxyacetate dioxygenase
MNIEIMPISGDFGAKVRGVNLTQPIDSATFKQIHDAFNRYGFLVFPGQTLTDDEQIEFSKRFGPLEVVPKIYPGNQKRRLADNISDISNLDENGQVWGERNERRLFMLANMLWHTDSSFKKVPALCSMLSARAIPPTGGETEFADMRAAYDELPEERKRALEGLKVEHSIFRSRTLIGYGDFQPELYDKLPPVEQMLVRYHPVSGRKSLYLASHASHVIGPPIEEGRKLIEELIEYATQPRFVYQHVWTVGDVVMWDNRCTMHRGRPFDDMAQKRDMHRTTVSEHANTVEQALEHQVANA